MITENSQCPAWIRELVRFTPLKNLLFVYGNVYDRVSYPVAGQDGAVNWSESELQLFFKRFLELRGYGLIGFFDPVDGLSFGDGKMEDLYKKLYRGKQVETPRKSEEQKAAGGQTSATSTQTCSTEDAQAQFKPGDTDLLRVINGIRKTMANETVPCAFVFNLASRLLASPTYLGEKDKDIFTRMLKASLTARAVAQGESKLNNVIILICEKLNDLPAFLYLNNPRARSIHLPKPDTGERTRYIERYYRAFYKSPSEPEPELTAEMSNLFSAMTEGLTYYEMASLVNLSNIEKEPLKNIKKICERFKYGINESEWDKIGRNQLNNAEELIRKDVKGQDVAVAAVLDIIKRAKIGLAAGSSGKTSRPRGVLFFAGPTGVGKTEMAKAMAKLLFGQEDRCIRFDMSEYSAEHSDQKLMGAPPGYVGYEEGGQLTSAVRENPFSILLFDEIEKADGSIFDKFLQILDDGRLTDGKGETVYFSECIIIFTSNLGTVSRKQNEDQSNSLNQFLHRLNVQQDDENLVKTDVQSGLVTPDLDYSRMRSIILKRIKEHFNFELKRPEILNRFGDNFVVFDFIRPPIDEEIVDLMIDKLKTATQEGKQIELTIEQPAREKLIELSRKNLQHGGRGIRNVIDKSLVDPLNRVLFDQEIDKNVDVKITELLDHGETAPVRFELKVECSPRCS